MSSPSSSTSFKSPKAPNDAKTSNDSNIELKVMLLLSEVKGQLGEMKDQYDCMLLEIRENASFAKDIFAKLDDVQKKTENNEKEITQLKKEMSEKETAVRKVHSRIDKVVDNFEKLSSDMNETKTRCGNLERKLYEVSQQRLELDARCRRNNLLFHGVPETDEDNTRAELTTFLVDKCGLSNGNELLLQSVHRVPTRKTPGKTRPIIAKFVDFRQRELVRSTRSNLKGKQAISQDLPKEIRNARRVIADQFAELRKNKDNRLGVAYPCKLICNNQVIRIVDPLTLKDIPVGRRP